MRFRSSRFQRGNRAPAPKRTGKLVQDTTSLCCYGITDAPPEDSFHPAKDWHMTAAESVVIRDSGGFVRRGTVETVMPDASGLWIEGTGIEPRQYFDKASGFEVWVQAPDKLR